MSADTIQTGVFSSSSTAQTAKLIPGNRYLLLIGQSGNNFNTENITLKISDGNGNSIAIPTPGSTDSSGSPQSFAAEGMIEFAAGDTELELLPSGTLTDVSWKLVNVGQMSEFGKFRR